MEHDEPLIINLPNPVVVILIGLQGSGKSTLAYQHFAPAEILSTDDFRARMCNDPASQSNTGPARAQLLATLRCRLANKVTTVVDSTNLRATARTRILDLCREASVPAVAILLDTALEQCRQRIAKRARIILDSVLNEHADLWTKTVAAVETEQYRAVYHLTEPELARVRFSHARPTQQDPDRWVTVEQIGTESPVVRMPADEVRRHPKILATLRPTPCDYARVAVESVASAMQDDPAADIEVSLPHCLPVRFAAELAAHRDGKC